MLKKANGKVTPEKEEHISVIQECSQLREGGC